MVITKQWWVGLGIVGVAVLAGTGFWWYRQAEYRSGLSSPAPTPPGPTITEPTPAPPTRYEVLAMVTTSAATEITSTTADDAKRRILFTDRDEALVVRFTKSTFDGGRFVLAALAKRGEQVASVLGEISFTPAAKVTTLLANFGTTEAPVMSEDGKRIAYIVFSNADPDYGYSLLLMNPDGSNKRRLVKKETLLTTPTFNPDGSRLAYLTDTGSGMAIESVDVSGSAAPQRIAEFANETVYDLSWGKELVFGKRPLAADQANKGEIYSVSETGSGLRRLTTNDAFDGSPVLSPDGSTLAFVRTVFASGQYNAAGELTLVVLNLSDGKETELGAADAVLGWRPVTESL